jgi:hypothetical protein
MPTDVGGFFRDSNNRENAEDDTLIEIAANLRVASAHSPALVKYRVFADRVGSVF